VSRFGLGHLADHANDVEADLRLKHVGHLLAAPARAPLAVNYADHLDAVQDQGPTSSCVGNALSSSIYLRAKLAGTPIPRPSRKAIYDFARLVDDPHKGLLDLGSRPRAAMVGLQDYGIVPESRWPLDFARINELPPNDVFQHAVDAMVTDYYRVGAGAGAATLVRQALARGFCPTFAMEVDQAYEDYDGSFTWDGLKGPSLGGHYQCVIGYGEDYLVVLNSWSSAWGDHGFARIGDRAFDAAATDILVPTVVPSRLT
jgi:hypothetical protein